MVSAKYLWICFTFRLNWPLIVNTSQGHYLFVTPACTHTLHGIDISLPVNNSYWHIYLSHYLFHIHLSCPIIIWWVCLKSTSILLGQEVLPSDDSKHRKVFIYIGYPSSKMLFSSVWLFCGCLNSLYHH